ncbi:30S ribosomal protein S2 [bacterium (Candidatus Moisslbacteria) CG02_land_8_20_14_3_00_36_53]|nr:MAG: 30S ribosomal protein S2 [bacterium (Candidatus Moisslbacteria) CG02_land_8_20_14_3_00_36_53]PIZ90521.1 MAG: 30S ribosomal protein S2 [bacterium (Candidatus Moisslbacteria) CG_4_10_14_0_2_um_filter_36_61]
MWEIPTVKQLEESGVTLGHKPSKRHPKMEPFIKGVQGAVNVIDPEKTAEKLEDALKFVEEIVKQNGVILFVGTKPPAQTIIRKYAEDCGMPYVANKWLAGTLTNFETISYLIKKYLKMKEEKEKLEWSKYTKKEALGLERELTRLEKMVGGISSLLKIPDVLYVVDLIEEKTAIREASRKKIKTVAIADTNSNPELVTYPIPANDDAIKSIDLITSLISQAVNEGLNKRQEKTKKSKTS